MNKNKPVSKRLFIGSLPYRFTEGELLDAFISEGKVVSIKIIYNRWGRSRGMGYVEFENESDAIRAKEKFHNHRINGSERTIIVDYAQPDPFLTPEGQANRQEAEKRHPNRYKTHDNSQDRNRSKGAKGKKEYNSPEEPIKLRFRPKKKARQSVFESRNFGSRVGAKFAARTKKNKKK